MIADIHYQDCSFDIGFHRLFISLSGYWIISWGNLVKCDDGDKGRLVSWGFIIFICIILTIHPLFTQRNPLFDSPFLFYFDGLFLSSISYGITNVDHYYFLYLLVTSNLSMPLSTNDSIIIPHFILSSPHFLFIFVSNILSGFLISFIQSGPIVLIAVNLL